MRPDEHGFTLLETLVALLVLGMIVAGLAQGLRFGLAGWDRQAAAIDRDGALDSTDRTLRGLLERMEPDSDPKSSAILGGADRMAFTTRLPAGAPSDKVRLSDIAIAVNGDHQLVLRWTAHLHATLLAPPVSKQAILLPGVAAIRFGYYDGEQGWSDSWKSGHPPELVRIHLEFTGKALHWPDLIVAPVMQSDQN